mgnify:CR=1 FL=1
MESKKSKLLFILVPVGIIILSIAVWFGLNSRQPQTVQKKINTYQFGYQALKINGEYVSQDIFKEEQNKFFLKWRRDAKMLHTPDDERTDLLLEEIINRLVLEDYLQNRANIKVSDQEVERYLEITKNGFSTSAEFDSYVSSRYAGKDEFNKEIRTYLLKNKCLLQAAKEYGIKISAAEIEREYQRQRNDNTRATVKRILVSTDSRAPEDARKLANDIYTKLKNGADFAEMAQNYSDDAATKQNGGVLESVGRNMMGPEFDERVFNAKPGQLLAPFKTHRGYEIVRVEKIRTFAFPKKEIAEVLTVQKFTQSDAYNKWLAKLKSAIKIEITDPVLKAYRLFKNKEYTSAAKEYEKAFDLYRFDYYLSKAIECSKLAGEFQEMIRLGNKGLKLSSKKVPYYLSIAEGLYNTKQEKEAKKVMKRAEASAGKNLYYRNLIAQLYSKMGMEKDAERMKQ